MKKRIFTVGVLVSLALLAGLGLALASQKVSSTGPWGPIRRLSTSPEIRFPRMVVEQDGSAHVVWVVPGWTSYTMYATTNPEGAVTGPYTVTSPSLFFIDDLIRDSAGNFFMTGGVEGYWGIFKPKGGWWRALEQISPRSGWWQRSTSTFDAEGKVHIVYPDDYNFYYAHNRSGRWIEYGQVTGAAHTTMKVVTTRENQLMLIRAFLDNYIEYAVKDPTAGAWPAFQPLFDSSIASNAWSFPALAKDEFGFLHAFAPVDSPNDVNTAIYHRVWNGNSWSEPEVILKPFDPHSPWGTQLWSAFDRDGNVIVLWGYGDTVYEVTKLQGQVWTGPREAFRHSSGIMPTGIGTDSQGRIHVVFQGYWHLGPYYVVREPLGVSEPATLSLSPIQVGEGPYPFLPNQVTLKTTVTNQGPVEARNVRVQFFNGNPTSGGSQIGEASLGNVPQGENREATYLWSLTGNLENATIYAKAVCDNQQSGNAEASMVSTPLSVYYVDFRLNRDAYSFSNSLFGGIPGTPPLDSLLAFLQKFRPPSISSSRLVATLLIPIAQSSEEVSFGEGRCFGMAASSAIYRSLPLEKPRPVDTYELTFQEWEVRDRINFLQNGQVMFNFRHLSYAFGWPYSAPGMEKDLLFGLKTYGTPQVLCLFSPRFGLQAYTHAVVVYKALVVGGNKRFILYDVNEPIHALSTVNYGSFDAGRNAFAYRGIDFQAYPYDPLDWYRGSITGLFLEVLDRLSPFIRVFIGSPVESLITDQYGRRLGTRGGEFFSEIPEAEKVGYEGKVQYSLPANLTYTLETIGVGGGAMLVGISQPISGNTVEQVIYTDVPVAAGSRARVQFYPGNVNRTMETSAGNREPDEVVQVVLPRVYLPLLLRTKDTSRPTPTHTVTPTRTATPTATRAPTLTPTPTNTPSAENVGRVWGHVYDRQTGRPRQGITICLGSTDGWNAWGGTSTSDEDGAFKFWWLPIDRVAGLYCAVWICNGTQCLTQVHLTLQSPERGKVHSHWKCNT